MRIGSWQGYRDFLPDKPQKVKLVLKSSGFVGAGFPGPSLYYDSPQMGYVRIDATNLFRKKMYPEDILCLTE